MSADNTIAILETGIEKKEYRVAHLQAVENIQYDENAPDLGYCPNKNTYCKDHTPDICTMCIAYENRYYSDNLDVLIRNARKMWKDCPVYNDEAEAFLAAKAMYEEIGYCEYGIRTIKIPRDFTEKE